MDSALTNNALKVITLVGSLFGHEKAYICRDIALSYGETSMYEVVEQWMDDTVHRHAFAIKLICGALARGWNVPPSPYVFELGWSKLPAQLELIAA